jgi:hypothetical protein
MQNRWNGGAKCATFSIHLLCSIVKGSVRCMTLLTSFIFLVFFYYALGKHWQEAGSRERRGSIDGVFRGEYGKINRELSFLAVPDIQAHSILSLQIHPPPWGRSSIGLISSLPVL